MITSERPGADKKPDIMVIMSDQHGFLDTGFGDGRVDTPELQRIAGEGMLFERCYCNAPLCVPSRMSFLTGQLPSDLGIFNLSVLVLRIRICTIGCNKISCAGVSLCQCSAAGISCVLLRIAPGPSAVIISLQGS